MVREDVLKKFEVKENRNPFDCHCMHRSLMGDYLIDAAVSF